MTSLPELADDLLDAIAAEDPLNDFIDGLPGHEHHLGVVGEDAQERLRRRALDIAAAAETVDTDDRLTKALVLQQAEALVNRIDAKLIEFTMKDHMVSPTTRLLARLPQAPPQALLARLASVPEFLDQAAERHRVGVAAGRVPVGYRVDAAVAYLDSYLDNPADDPLRGPELQGSDSEERERLLADVVRPAVVKYRHVLAEEIASHGRPEDRAGLCWLPDGAETYAALAREHTTTNRTPEELHQTGLDLIERLGDEYVEIGGGSLAEVQHRIRTDPALKFRTAEEILDVARSTIERAEQVAPDWFGRMPAHRCAVEATPAADAPTTSTAAYHPGPMDGSSPGIYYANTYRAAERDRTIAEANAFHEGVPGHHFQISLAQELTGLSQLRQSAWINSYLEGWALYSERLADEMGLYSDDIARLGMVAMDSMRSARLVVDTGLHALGWSRQQAVDYLRVNTVMTELEIQHETDRYIENPGQALSYMVGRLEIQRMRSEAEAAMGAAFDIRAFHDLVLGTGPLPLDVLNAVVSEWAHRR